jgi:hypothetical protein
MLPQRLRAAFHRFLGDIRFALGTALGAVAVGAVLGAITPIPAQPLLPDTAPWANRLVAVAELGLSGWIMGLLWGIVVAICSRRLAPQLPPRSRARAAALAAVGAVAVAAPLLLLGKPLGWAVGGAVAAATLVMLATLLAARRSA